MNWSLIIFTVVVLWFGFRGYRNGIYKSTTRILSLIAGYACAFLLTGSLTPIIATQLHLDGMIGLLVSATILFVGASALFNLIFWMVSRLAFEDREHSRMSAISGAMVSSAMGVLLAIMLVWTLSFARSAGLGNHDSAKNLPESNTIEVMSNRVVGSAVSAAMNIGSIDAEMVQFSAAFIESPGEVIVRGQKLMQSPELKALMQSRRSQQVLNSGDPTALQSLPEFQALARSADMQAIITAIELDKQAHKNDRSVSTELATQMTRLWRQAQSIKAHPRAQEIINDPLFQQQLRAGDPIALLNNPELLELSQIIVAAETPSDRINKRPDQNHSTGKAKTLETAVNASSATGQHKPGTLYQWEDENGRVYFSDKSPSQQ